MYECVVCGHRTCEWVTLAGLGESVPLCSGRCQQAFIHDPLQYLGAEMATGEPVPWDRRT